MGVIYVRPNKINGKKYVGQATDLKTRQYNWNNLNQPYAGPAINAARAKYGIDNFGFEILKECKDDELDYWEKYYIKELNTKAPYGYNLTDGGEGMSGYTLSEETKKKMSDAQKGRKRSAETKRKIGDAQKGRKRSAETKRKMSDAQKGIKLSAETKRKIGEAHKGRKLSGESKKKISETLKGRKKPPRSEEHKKHLSEAKKNGKLSKPLLQINKYTNEVIAEFPSVSEVERQLGISISNVSNCCNGKYKTAYGYIWKYKESVA